MLSVSLNLDYIPENITIIYEKIKKYMFPPYIDSKPYIFIMSTKSSWNIYTYVEGISDSKKQESDVMDVIIPCLSNIILMNGNSAPALSSHQKNLFCGTASKTEVVMRWKYKHDLNIHHWPSAFCNTPSLEQSRIGAWRPR